MPAVPAEDMNQQEFVSWGSWGALAAFLKKSGKLKFPEWVDTVRLAKHKELAPYDENWLYTRAASTAWHLHLWGSAGVGSMGVSEKWGHSWPLQQRFQEHGPQGPPSPSGAENGRKGQRWGS